MNRRHMTGDHHGQTAGRATLLARAMDEILGTHTTSQPLFSQVKAKREDLTAFRVLVRVKVTIK